MKKLKNLLQAKIKNKIKIFFLFDYDGTLVPIQNDPTKTILSQEIKDSLINLSKNKMFKVAIVSGRTIATLKKLTKIKSKEIIFIGSHGFELLYNGKESFLSKVSISEINKIKSKALKIATGIANGFLEYKPYTFTYHIRDKRKLNHVLILSTALKKLLKQNKLNKKLKVMKGKNIIEILPLDVSKGNAIKKIIKIYPNYFFMYFGDDITDISAMREVDKYKGLSVSLNRKLNYKYKSYLSSTKKLCKLVFNLK